MDAKHTPGPWHVATNPGGPDDQPVFFSVRDGSGRPDGEDTVCVPLGDSETVKANTARIVSCVNACEGINPEAVPALLESLMAVMRICDRNTPVFAAAREAIVKATGIKLGECESCRKTVPVYELTRVIAAGGIETFACDECRGIQN